MNRSILVTALAAGSALAGAGYWLSRRPSPRALPSTVIPIIVPVIDLGIAEDVLEAMEHLRGDEVTLVLHTLGGCVTSCVMIANALRQFERSTAIGPYLAISGGTLIALNAQHLQMGRSAALSAVDPIVEGQRVKHLPEDDSKQPANARAREYEAAIGGFLLDTLTERLPGASDKVLSQAMDTFMGEHAPHEWPIRRIDVAALGLEVSPAAPSWAQMVDAYRRRWWR